MSNIKTMVRSAYDLQKLRIQMGNRITMQFKVKLGQAPSESEDELDEDAKEILATLRLSYNRITDGVADNKMLAKAKFRGDGVIDSYTEYCLVEQYLEVERAETHQFKRLGKALEDYPIYTEFLQNVKGIGPAMAGVLISEFDIHKSKYASSMWKYAGLDVKPDGRGASRKAGHLIDVEYKAADGTIKTKKSLGYNAWLKTKLIGVLATSFLRTRDCPYRVVYDNYKHRLQNHPKWAEASKGHIHAASMRYMVKIFLIDLYTNWRKIEGLSVHPPYHEAKLGLKHEAA